MKKYLYYYLLFTCLLVVIPADCILFLYRLGEYESIDSVIEKQKNEKVIYGTSIHSNTDMYKMALLTDYKPNIISLGSSRVMQFRQHMFLDSFVNLGGLVNSINQGLYWASDIAAGKPKIILFGVDVWWFNEYFHNPLSKYKGKKYQNYYPKSGDVVSVLRWLITGKISFQEMLNMTSTASADIGLSGYFKDGFGPDGSYYYTRLITGQKEPHDKKFGDTFQRIENGNNRFKYSSKAHKQHIDNFILLIRALEESGSDIIIFFPPFANAVNARLNEKDGKYDYIRDVKYKLIEKGIKYYDYTNAVLIGSSDCEFIDGFHGGEVTYMRILADISKTEPSLADLVDSKVIHSSITKHKGHVFIPDMEIINRDEVDFLGIGCKK
jgi:hypothetical protein